MSETPPPPPPQKPPRKNPEVHHEGSGHHHYTAECVACRLEAAYIVRKLEREREALRSDS